MLEMQSAARTSSLAPRVLTPSIQSRMMNARMPRHPQPRWRKRANQPFKAGAAWEVKFIVGRAFRGATFGTNPEIPNDFHSGRKKNFRPLNFSSVAVLHSAHGNCS
jgi:hypothetical protein